MDLRPFIGESGAVRRLREMARQVAGKNVSVLIPRVREATVVVREDAPGSGGRRLVAYLSAEGEPPAAPELRAHVSATLPEYMVPSAFVVLEKLPLTPNGKTDRRALPAPGPGGGAGAYVAPRTAEEAVLARIWGEVLGVERVGVQDDFFALGGHSRLAVRLVSRIRQETGARVPLHALFAGGTVERLAVLLAGGSDRAVRPPLVAIRGTGSRRPFFCVHAVDGHVLSYAALAGRLDHDRPFYGLQAAGVDGGEPLVSVEAMAAAYVAAVRAVQPEGPNALGGWSMGGVVAFEAARRLRAAGETVDALVLLDIPRAVRPPDTRDEAELLEGTLRDLAGALPRDPDPGRLGELLRVRRANLHALRTYVPGAYDGRALLLGGRGSPRAHPRRREDPPVGIALRRGHGGPDRSRRPLQHAAGTARPGGRGAAGGVPGALGAGMRIATPGAARCRPPAGTRTPGRTRVPRST